MLHCIVGLELIMSVYAVSVSVNFLVSLSLLAGVKLERRWLLLPWISWNSLSLVVSQMAVFYAPNRVSLACLLWRKSLSTPCVADALHYPGHILDCHQCLLHSLRGFLFPGVVPPPAQPPHSGTAANTFTDKNILYFIRFVPIQTNPSMNLHDC